MKSTYKWLAIISFMVTTYLVAHYHKSKVDEYFSLAEEQMVLEVVPEVSFDGDLKMSDLLQKHKVTVVHFWGTWCAPCEKEFPDLYTLMKRLAYRDVFFVLVAVNDEEMKVKKFIKRFNFAEIKGQVVYDPEGKAMAKFGTVKVPETYVFSQDGKTLKKYIGPQEWRNDYYFDYLASVAQ